MFECLNEPKNTILLCCFRFYLTDVKTESKQTTRQQVHIAVVIFTINFDRILASTALFPLQINIIWICFVRYIPFYFLLINDTRKEKTVFYSIQYMNGCLAASDLFHMFTQSMKFYTFPYHVLNSTDV